MGMGESVISAFVRRPVTCVNAEGGRLEFIFCGECVRKLGPSHLLAALIWALTCAGTREGVCNDCRRTSHRDLRRSGCRWPDGAAELRQTGGLPRPVSYTHLRAHET